MLNNSAIVIGSLCVISIGYSLPHLRGGCDRSTKRTPPSNNSIHDTDCKTMPDFATVKELVEQHVDSY